MALQWKDETSSVDKSFLCPQGHWFFSSCGSEEPSIWVFLMCPREGCCCPGVVALFRTRLDEIWSHNFPLPRLDLQILILLSESKVWKTLRPLVLFIFIFTKNVQILHFNMPLVMTPDGGSPNSVTPARPSCDIRACATLTRDWKINTFITYYTSA